MLDPIQKFLACLVALSMPWMPQMASLFSLTSPWHHDGHQHQIQVVDTGDSLVVTLCHLPTAEDSHHDDDPAMNCAGVSAHHQHHDHVMAFSTAKFASWPPPISSFQPALFAETSLLFDHEAPLTCIGEFLGNGVAARPPPWGKLAKHCNLRATVMMV